MNFIFSLFLASFLLYSSNSDAPPLRHDFMLVAALDGTVSLLDPEGPTTVWSVKTGDPIYSSYQTSEVDFEHGDGSYIDCEDDWNLFRHDTTKGTFKRLGSARGLLTKIDKYGPGSTSVSSEVKISLVVVDAYDGTVLANSYDGGVDDRKKAIAIFRKDYKFEEVSQISGNVVWNVSLAEFDAFVRCPLVENSPCESHDMDVNRVRRGFSQFDF